MKKLLLFTILILSLSGCEATSMIKDGSYSESYNARVIGHIESENTYDKRLYIVKIDNKYYYATYDDSWNIGPEVQSNALRRHKERLDF